MDGSIRTENHIKQLHRDLLQYSSKDERQRVEMVKQVLRILYGLLEGLTSVGHIRFLWPEYVVRFV